MRSDNSSTARPEPQSIPLDKKAKRQRIQVALERFVTGQATHADYDVIRDRAFMYSATALQCCQFIEAAPGRTVPFDVYHTIANTLRIRWLQSLSGRRSGSMLSRESVEVPVISCEGESES